MVNIYPRFLQLPRWFIQQQATRAARSKKLDETINRIQLEDPELPNRHESFQHLKSTYHIERRTFL